MSSREPITDTERLNYLGNVGANLVTDDDGRWAVSDTGTQPVPELDGFNDPVHIAALVLPNEWKRSIRDAIDYAIREDQKAVQLAQRSKP